MHLCRSSSNVPRPQAFLNLLSNLHVFITSGKVQNPLRLPSKTTSKRPKMARDRQVLTRLTWTCASSHNAVHFFNISISKSGLRPSVFYMFHFQICFEPQRRALFPSINVQKRSQPTVLFNILAWTCASLRRCGVFNLLAWKCASCPNGVQIFISHLPPATPEHFWKLRCWKNARCCGAKHISKSKC